MREFTREQLEAGRPTVSSEDAIGFVLDALFQDTERSLHDEVVSGLSFEELIGALLLAKDLAEEAASDDAP